MSWILFITICLLLYSESCASDEVRSDNVVVDCSSLRMGQYICPDPNQNQIDPVTQQYFGCTKGKDIASEGEANGEESVYEVTKTNLIRVLKDNPFTKFTVWCIAADRIICNETKNSTFYKKLPCKWTNGYSLEIALLLSVFLGMFGLDRFYLGYPGIGLAKLCTLGFMFLGQLLDIILIAAQVVGPSDGSAYVIPYYGAGVTVVRSDNETYLLPQADWHNIT